MCRVALLWRKRIKRRYFGMARAVYCGKGQLLTNYGSDATSSLEDATILQMSNGTARMQLDTRALYSSVVLFYIAFEGCKDSRPKSSGFSKVRVYDLECKANLTNGAAANMSCYRCLRRGIRFQ